MPIEMGSVFSNVNSVVEKSKLGKIFSSIFYTSFLLAFVMVLMVTAFCPKNKLWTNIRLFVYISLATIVVLSIHNGIVKNIYQNKFKDENSSHFIENMKNSQQNPVFQSERVSIMPRDVAGGKIIQEESVSDMIEQL